MSAFIQFLEHIERLAAQPVRIRFYGQEESSTVPHYPDWHFNFANTGLFLYAGFGSAEFRAWNEEQSRYLSLAANNSKKNGQIEDQTIYYRVNTYRTQIQSIFENYREALERFVPHPSRPALIANVAEDNIDDANYVLSVPLLLTENQVLNNLTIIGDLLPGIDHSALLAKRDENKSVALSEVFDFVRQLSIPVPPIPVVLGIDSEIHLETFAAEPIQTSTYEDVRAANTPDYVFDVPIQCALEEIGALFGNSNRLFALTVDQQPVGWLFEYDNQRILFDLNYQIVQNPASFDGWIFEQKLYRGGEIVTDFYGSQIFEQAVPAVLTDWVRQKVQLCLESQGRLQNAQEALLHQDLRFNEALKWISLNEFHTANEAWSQYIQQLVANFDQIKERFQFTTPTIDDQTIVHATWHLLAQWLNPTIPSKRAVHILNATRFNYGKLNQTIQKNILIRFQNTTA